MLTALELTGFKSFADRTRLEFPAGVTAVVGPNGSGKSNVVDAIKWVLGSQSPKALRGAEMTDVIFNGSTSRRPVNTAEVTLEFDNSGGLFPVGGPIADGESRVRLTRRVYRSGEGEYLINGVVVRLRDLKGLLAGTGMGGQGGGSYGIIEQGRVDAVLQSSPTERRSLFEEAAGISRFRLKKQEAGRRLARVEQNLLRLSDIVDEVEGRLRRVRAQAGKAQRYREQADRLKQLRTELGLADWRTLSATLADLETEAQQTATRRGAIEQELAEREAALDAQDSAGDEAAEGRSDDEQRLLTTREAIAALEARLTTEARRHAQAETELKHARRAMLTAETAPDPDAGDTDADADNHARAKTLADAARERAAAADAAVLAAKEASEAATETSRRLASERQAAHRGAVEAKTRAETLATQLREAQAKAASKRESAAHRAHASDEANATREAMRQTVQQHEASLKQAADALSEVRERTALLREQLLKSQKELARAEADFVGAEHRHAAIEELEDKLEKLAADIRGVLTAGPGAPTIHGMVADLLHVDYDTAPMIEAALGAAAQHLVVDSADQLVGALAGGQASLRVRARFQRLDASHPLAAIDRVDLTGEPGVMGRADTFADSDPQYQPLVRRLLGRTWFVDTLATAARLSTGVGRGLTFVTHDGDVLAADGGIFVGPKGEDGRLITGRQQASDLQEELDTLANTVETGRQRVAELEAESAGATEQEHARFDAHSEATAALAASRQSLATLDERADSLRRQLEEQSAAVQKGEQRFADLQNKSQAAQREADRLLAAEAEADRATEEAARLANTFEGELAAAVTAAADARVELAKADHAVESLNSNNDRRRRGDAERERLRAELLRQRRQAEAELEASGLAVLGIRAELAERVLVRDGLAASAEAAASRRRQQQRARRRDAKRVQELRQAMGQFTAAEQRLEIQATEKRHQRKTLADRMAEDYGIDLAAVASASTDPADAADTPPSATVDPSKRGEMERELDRLRNQVQSIGPVNSEALEELDDLQERFEHLSGQYRDLSSAKASLERLTGRINADSRELFLATIETVRGHFRELFRRLFGGGEADLVLLQEEEDGGADVLEAGVEVVAQPPGKELSSISLLSGGEKTMTCVALLLALFRTKPSPFCVLDEVDAALDEANIGRFTTVITEFLSSTQFLVVTHSKKTMMGADTIYGVTMQEPGVSTRVGVRFEDVDDQGRLRIKPRSAA